MIEVIQVRLRELGKVTYYNARGIHFGVGEYVVLEADRGIDYGEVVGEPEHIKDSQLEEPLKAIIRKVDEKDLEKIERNKEDVREVHRTCEKKIMDHNLPMKLVQTEYSFDKSKLVFYFTSEGRVDFRSLVKDLASIFKVRIELRQIGVRDEAKMLGGLGHCGRQLCCGTFLKDFEPVTIKMAKEQNLSLNPAKISGVCGRLMCCLDYEYRTYKQMSKYLPLEGEILKTPDGTVRVRSVDVLNRKVTVELESGSLKELSFSGCTCPKEGCCIHKDIVRMKRRKNKKNKNEKDSNDDKKGKGESGKRQGQVRKEKKRDKGEKGDKTK